MNMNSFLSLWPFVLQAQIMHSDNTYVILVLFNSGAAANFIDQATAIQLKLPLD